MSRGPRRKGFVEPTGYDHEAGSECHVPMGDLEQEFDAAEEVFEQSAWETAAFQECATKLALTWANLGKTTFRRRKKPANDNGRSS